MVKLLINIGKANPNTQKIRDIHLLWQLAPLETVIYLHFH